MSNDPAEPHGEFANLEPLPDLPQEVPPPAAAARGARSGQGSAGQSPASLAARAQEKAPRLLKNAAYLLVVGSLFPWVGELDGSAAWINLALKLVLLGGCKLLLSGVDAHYAGTARPLLAGQKGMLGAINASHVAALVVIVGVLIGQLAWLSDHLLVVSESLTLLLGGITYVHIDSYLKGGKFNPLFPLMFGGCALGGLFALFARISDSQWMAAFGCAIVTMAGILAVYTIGIAMVQAKKDGDLKKAAAIEARKQARGSTRGQAENRGPAA